MRPATEPSLAFAHSNPFALALLGIESQARALDRALPQGRTTEALLAEPASHPLDLALLGLLSLGERIATLGPVEPTEPLASEPPAPLTDVLR